MSQKLGDYMEKSEEIQRQITDYKVLKQQILKHPELEEELLRKSIPKKTIYEHMRDCTEKIGNKTAQTLQITIEKDGKKFKTQKREVTYAEMDEKISDFSKIYPALGLHPQERIGLLLPNLPESTYIIYGANKKGVVTDNIDPTSQPSKLQGFIAKEHVKAIICFDLLYDKTIRPIEHYLKDELGITDVIVASITDSLLFPDRELVKLSNKINKIQPIKSNVLNIIPLRQALKDSRYMDNSTYGYKPNELAAICHSSGTTGLPKPIPVTNENMNFMHIQHELTDFHHNDIETALHVLPGFAQFGLTDSMHLQHCSGFNLIEIPEFPFEKFVDILLDTKTNCVFGVPSWWLRLAEDEKYKSIDLSFLYDAVAGGDKMTPEQIQKVNEFLVRHGAKCLLRIGYGMSEFGGTCILADSYRTPIDSCGQPLIGSYGKIIDSKTGVECKPYEMGTLYFRKISMPPKEFDGQPLYKRSIIDGQEYVNTGDIMYKDEKGNYYFLARESGMISRHEGYKVIPSKLENCISENPFVKSCMVSYYYDETKYGNMPFIHLVLNKEYSDTEIDTIIRDIIDNYILKNKDLCFRDIPSRWAIKDQLFITSGLKKDYMRMHNEGLNGNEIKVTTDETNIGLNGYIIEFPQKQKETIKKLYL